MHKPLHIKEVTDAEFQRVLEWLTLEREQYQMKKFDYGDRWDDKGTREFKDEDNLTRFNDLQWVVQIDNYIHRAYVLGVDTPGGKQAIAKAAATVVAMVESVVRLYGDLPTPGVPSGELSEWQE